jgi:hypothetical protein
MHYCIHLQYLLTGSEFVKADDLCTLYAAARRILVCGGAQFLTLRKSRVNAEILSQLIFDAVSHIYAAPDGAGLRDP